MLRFEPWKIALVCVISLLAILYAAPNFMGGDAPAIEGAERPSGWLPGKTVHLGLDLQGGVHLLIEVEVEAVVGQIMDNLVEEVRPVLRGERIGYTGLGRQGDSVAFKLREPGDADKAMDLLKELDPDTVVESDGAGGITIALTEDKALERRRDAVTKTIEVIRKRIDELGTTEPTIQRQGESRILLQVPGLDDPERLKELIGRTAVLEIRMVDEATPVSEAVGGRVPPGSELLYETGDEGARPIVVRKKVLLDGEKLTMAAATTDQYGRPAVAIRFNAAGARIFGKLTTENVNKRFAIILDGEVISAPVINEPIPGGNGQITGNFTIATANDLSLLLRAGALPAPLSYAEERTVGPSLGADSVAAGKIASIIGLALVVAYMIVSYGLFGIASTIALALNIALILAVLSILQATLTLPGIAGIVLTIGMAVDANVLIFERIREEVRNGRTPFSAVDIGFQQALRTIIDANLTTLIAAVILFQFGSGPVKGFAVTLGIGIFTSVFSAMMITRLIVVLWLRRTRPQKLPI
jgi:preprotein translocase subunit SecD